MSYFEWCVYDSNTSTQIGLGSADTLEEAKLAAEKCIEPLYIIDDDDEYPPLINLTVVAPDDATYRRYYPDYGWEEVV